MKHRNLPESVLRRTTKGAETDLLLIELPRFPLLRETLGMHRLTLILTFLFSLMFSSPSYSYWTKIGENVSGNTFYVDFERIRKHGGHVYWWTLLDYLKPDKWGGVVRQNVLPR